MCVHETAQIHMLITHIITNDVVCRVLYVMDHISYGLYPSL
jgi:hypothetical protein